MRALAYHLDPLHDLDGLSVRPQPLPKPGRVRSSCGYELRRLTAVI